MCTSSTREKTFGTLIIHLDNRCGGIYVNRIVGHWHPLSVFNSVMKHMV